MTCFWTLQTDASNTLDIVLLAVYGEMTQC